MWSDPISTIFHPANIFFSSDNFENILDHYSKKKRSFQIIKYNESFRHYSCSSLQSQKKNMDIMQVE